VSDQLSAATLDRYYRRVQQERRPWRKVDGHQIVELACELCGHLIRLSDVPKQTPFGDSNLGKVARLRGAMRAHLRDKHALQIAVCELGKDSVAAQGEQHD
jgi:hypothetical protein